MPGSFPNHRTYRENGLYFSIVAMTGYVDLPEEPHPDLERSGRTKEMLAERVILDRAASWEVYKFTAGHESISGWQDLDEGEVSTSQDNPKEMPWWLLYQVSHYVRWDRVKEVSLAPGQTRTETFESAVGVETSVMDELHRQEILSAELSAKWVKITGRDETGRTNQIRVSADERHTVTASDSWSNSSDHQVQEISIWQRTDIIVFEPRIDIAQVDELDRRYQMIEQTVGRRPSGLNVALYERLVGELPVHRIELPSSSFRTKSRHH